MNRGLILVSAAIALTLLGVASAQSSFTMPLSAVVSNSNTQINMGQATTVTIYVSGGQGPYTVQAVAAATHSTLDTQSGVQTVYSYQFTPASPGKYIIIFYITDQQNTKILKTATIEVVPTSNPNYSGRTQLSATASPTQTTTEAGESASVTVIPSGGTPGYTIGVYVNGAFYTSYHTGGQFRAATPYTFSYTPPQPGLYNIGFVLTDSAGGQVTTYAQITANPNPFQEQSALQVSVTPAYGTTSVGSTLPISVSVTGGVPDYTIKVYQQSSTPLTTYTFDGHSQYVYTFMPMSAGNYIFSFVVTDRSGNTQTGLATVNVNGFSPGAAPGATGGPLGVTVTPSSASASPGQPVQISITPVGGAVPYAIVLYINGVYQQEFVSTGQYTYTYTPSVPGQVKLDFRVYSADTSVDGYSTITTTGAGSYTSNPYGGGFGGSITPTTPLTASVNPQLATVNAGQSVSVQVNPSGGTPPYTVFVYDNGAFKTEQQNINGGSYTYTFTPTQSGQTENIGFKVVDSGTGLITTYSSINVAGQTPVTGSAPGPLSASVTPQSTTTATGQSTPIQVAPSGGTPPYFLFFYDNGAYLTEISQVTGSYTYSYQPSSPGVHNIGVKIVDSGNGLITAFSSVNVQSTSTVTTTIPQSGGGLSITVSPQSTSISSGQSASLTITPTGGTGPYYIFVYDNGAYLTEIPAVPSTAVYAYTPTQTGIHNLGLKIVDSSSGLVTSFATVTVN